MKVITIDLFIKFLDFSVNFFNLFAEVVDRMVPVNMVIHRTMGAALEVMTIVPAAVAANLTKPEYTFSVSLEGEHILRWKGIKPTACKWL